MELHKFSSISKVTGCGEAGKKVQVPLKHLICQDAPCQKLRGAIITVKATCP